jgi:hypothetical protein
LAGDTNGSIDFSDGANLLYTPGADFNGTATLSYTVSDGSVTDAGTITITVTAANDAPVAVDDAVTIRSTTNATNIDVLGNDTDTEGGTLTVSNPIISSGDTTGTVTTDGT